MPQARQKQSGLEKALPIAGAVAGGMLAGPGAWAAIQGAAGGMGVGSTGAGLLAGKPKAEVAPVQSNAGGAMQRRMDSMQASNSNIKALRDAESSLASLPPQQAQTYAPTIKKARYLAEQEIA